VDVAASVTLLGTWRATVAGAEVTVPAACQRIVALLGLSGRLSRPYLAGTLWGDLDDVRALRRLRSTLWRLPAAARPLIEVTDTALRLAPGVDVDVARVTAMAHALTEGGREVAPDEALALLSGPDLLVGWYDDWVVPEQERINQLRVHALEALADRLTAGRHFGAAIEAGFAAIRADPLRESAHRIVIRAHLAEGNPASALRQYDRYRRLLHSQLGLDHPSPDMVALVESIG